MRYGSAMVEKMIDGRKCVIRVRVRVERSSDAKQSHIRCPSTIAETAVGAGAWSGARFARARVDGRYFGIEILEITGDIDVPYAGMGAALASTLATWIAFGVDWQDADLGEMHGWSVRRQADV